MIIYGIVLNRFYPISKYAKVEIYSRKFEEVGRYLTDIGFSHKFDIGVASRFSTRKETHKLVTICTVMEVHELMRQVRMIDDYAAVSIIELSSFSGQIKTYQIGDRG
ncbi:hypothetical protein FACS1894166_13460 [Bacilli bacterium]|nr:hypothetical protein FACS1894166_13460 [Bacilli bacterium]